MKQTEWAVYFPGDFGREKGNQDRGKEFPIQKKFMWGSDTWFVLSAYLCEKGLVLDLCKQIEPESIRAFMEKWLDNHGYPKEFSDEMMEQLQAENPTDEQIRPFLRMNGQDLQWNRSCGIGWNPCLGEAEENSLEATSVVDHYRLDRNMGWVIERISFTRQDKKETKIENLQLSLSQQEVPVAGPHFKDLERGKELTFIHPITGEQHTLLVIEITQEQLPENYIHDERLILPRCVARISYTLTPDIPSDSFHMMDCSKGDRPVKRKSENEKELSKSSCDVAAIGIIGGTDGPTAIIYASRTNKKQLHNAYSAVHFEPVENIEWRMVFRKKMREDVVVEIQLNE